jgi:hypothetical protein
MQPHADAYSMRLVHRERQPLNAISSTAKAKGLRITPPTSERMEGESYRVTEARGGDVYVSVSHSRFSTRDAASRREACATISAGKGGPARQIDLKCGRDIATRRVPWSLSLRGRARTRALHPHRPPRRTTCRVLSGTSPSLRGTTPPHRYVHAPHRCNPARVNVGSGPRQGMMPRPVGHVHTHVSHSEHPGPYNSVDGGLRAQPWLPQGLLPALPSPAHEAERSLRECWAQVKRGGQTAEMGAKKGGGKKEGGKKAGKGDKPASMSDDDWALYNNFDNLLQNLRGNCVFNTIYCSVSRATAALWLWQHAASARANRQKLVDILIVPHAIAAFKQVGSSSPPPPLPPQSHNTWRLSLAVSDTNQVQLAHRLFHRLSTSGAQPHGWRRVAATNPKRRLVLWAAASLGLCSETVQCAWCAISV